MNGTEPFVDFSARPAAAAPEVVRQCAVIDAAELDRLSSEFMPRLQPVVIRGLRERFALEIFRWSADYLAPLLSDGPLPVMETETGFLSYERVLRPMPFRQFVERTFGVGPRVGPRLYFRNPTSVLPSHVEDTEQIPEFARYVRKAAARNLWISGSGLTVGLHFDPAENLNFQLRGHKRFRLYPPGTRGYYPLPLFSETAHISAVYRSGPNPNLARFPHFDPSVALDIHLVEGDLLYLPAYWWHMVDSIGEQNVNLNYWWLPAIARQLRHPGQMLRGYAQMALRCMRYGDLQQTAKPAA